jgi:hypothetical protein
VDDADDTTVLSDAVSLYGSETIFGHMDPGFCPAILNGQTMMLQSSDPMSSNPVLWPWSRKLAYVVLPHVGLLGFGGGGPALVCAGVGNNSICSVTTSNGRIHRVHFIYISFNDLICFPSLLCRFVVALLHPRQLQLLAMHHWWLVETRMEE